MKRPEYKDYDKQAGRLIKQKDIFYNGGKEILLSWENSKNSLTRPLKIFCKSGPGLVSLMSLFGQKTRHDVYIKFTKNKILTVL
jgi:hypothetical protein